MISIIQTIIIGIFCSLAAVGLLNVSYKLSLWFKIRPLISEYVGYNLNGDKLSQSPTFKINYKFWTKKLILTQDSVHRGNWKSELHIISEVPHNTTGVFKYDEGGKYGGQWGLHDVTINYDDCLIYVKAYGKKEGATAEYMLKKV